MYSRFPSSWQWGKASGASAEGREEMERAFESDA
jgi:hypothetical protein